MGYQCRAKYKYAEQSINKQDTVYVELNGERMALSQAAEKLRMNYGTLNSRINKLHWPALAY